MKFIVNTLILFLLTACSEVHLDQSESEKETFTVDNELMTDRDSTLSDLTEIPEFYKIIETPSVSIDSSGNSNILCGDANYWSIVSHGKQAVPFLLDKLKSAKQVNAIPPCHGLALTEGGLAFILIDEILNVPYFSVLQMQFDVFDLNCMFPSGLIEYVMSTPEETHHKIASWYLNSAHQYEVVVIKNEERTECQTTFGITTKLVAKE